MTTRREFLKLSTAAAPLATLFPSMFAHAALTDSATADRVIVLLRLGGGNDGLNTVVPIEDDIYHRARPSLRVAKNEAHRLTDELALHPALTGVKGLFDDGRVTIVNSVGYPTPDRSHFRSTDIWHTARTGDAPRRTGWAARAVDGAARKGSVPAIAVLDDEAPLALVGARTPAPIVPSIDDVLLKDDGLGRSARDAASAGERGANPALAHVRAATEMAVDTAARLGEVAAATKSDAFPPSRLGQRLATVNSLLRARLGTRVFYTALDGFDTHTRQKENHALLLADLDRSLKAWSDDLAATGDDRRVLLVTFSEFGRRVRENASMGTDHGAAAPLFCVGGGLNPGVLGDPPDLEDLDDGDVKFRVDFRRVYSTLLERWLGVDAREPLGDSFEPLPFV